MAEKLPGQFIVLDGPEGAGKTTQVERLVEWLRRQGRPATAVRDPGSHCSIQPCCQHQACDSPRSIHRSLSFRSVIPIRILSAGAGERCSNPTSIPSTYRPVGSN